MKKEKLYKFIQKAALNNLEITITTAPSKLSGFFVSCQTGKTNTQNTNKQTHTIQSYAHTHPHTYTERKDGSDCDFSQTFSLEAKRPSKCPNCRGDLVEEPKYNITATTMKFETLTKVDKSYVVFYDILSLSTNIFLYKKKKHLRGFSEYHYNSLSEQNRLSVGDQAKDIFGSPKKRKLSGDEVLCFLVFSLRNGHWNANFAKNDSSDDKNLDIDDEDLSCLFMHIRDVKE